MVDKLLEFLQRIQLILLVAEVEFLEVFLDFLAVVEEADLDEVEEQEEVELLALLEPHLVLLEDLHQPGDVLERGVAVVLKLADPAKPPGEVLPLLAPYFYFCLGDVLNLRPDFLEFEHVFGIDCADLVVLLADEGGNVLREAVLVVALDE